MLVLYVVVAFSMIYVGVVLVGCCLKNPTTAVSEKIGRQQARYAPK